MTIQPQATLEIFDSAGSNFDDAKQRRLRQLRTSLLHHQQQQNISSSHRNIIASNPSSSTLKQPPANRSKIPVYMNSRKTSTATTQIVESMENLKTTSGQEDEARTKRARKTTTNCNNKKLTRSKSMNQPGAAAVKDPSLTQTINLSSLSIRSTSLSASSLLDSTSESSLNVDRRSFDEMVRSLRRCLLRVEKNYSADLLYDYLRVNFRSAGATLHGLSVSSLESQLLNSSSSQNKSSPSMMRSTPMAAAAVEKPQQAPPIGFIFDLERKQDNSSASSQSMKLLLKNLKILRKLFAIVQNDLLADLLALELETLPEELVLSRSNRMPIFNVYKQDEYFQRVGKYHERLLDVNEKLAVLVNDQTACNTKILSAHSILEGKFETSPKQFEYLLRLTPDIVYKMRAMIKLCEKCYHLCVEIKRVKHQGAAASHAPRNSGLKKSMSIQCPPPENKHRPLELMNKHKSMDTEPSRGNFPQIESSKNWKTEGLLKATDSFIRETDCSSIVSGDDDESPTAPTTSGQKRLKALHEELRHVKRKVDSTLNTIDELQAYLRNLIERAERCERLQAQLRSDKDLIRKTERNLKFYASKQKSTSQVFGSSASSYEQNSDEVFRHQLSKQLDYLKYRYKLNLQDLSIEKMCAPEINAAIMDTERRLAGLETTLSDLKRYMTFVETKLSAADPDFPKPKPKINTKTASIRRHERPFGAEKVELPPLPQAYPSFNPAADTGLDYH